MIPEAAILCLALNGYHEARGEPRKAEMAVAMVVLNRAKRNPWSVCNVVFVPRQFSWTLALPGVYDKVAFVRSKRIAEAAFGTPDFTGGATHYHKTSINPRWARTMLRVGAWGDHVFYRRPK